MSPVRRDLKSNVFSNSIRQNSRIDEDWPSHDNTTACVWSVNDQLLVTRRFSPAPPKQQAITIEGQRVSTALSDLGLKATFVTSLFAGLKQANAGIEDIDLV